MGSLSMYQVLIPIFYPGNGGYGELKLPFPQEIGRYTFFASI